MSEAERELEDMKKRVREEYAKANHEPITAENFRQMAQFCENMILDMTAIFVNMQEKFKQGALAFKQLAEFLEKDAEMLEIEEKKQANVFERDEPTNPGPISTNNKGI